MRFLYTPLSKEFLFNQFYIYLDSWRNCGMHDNLKLPDKNEFIPSQFQLVEREQDNPSHPTIIEVKKIRPPPKKKIKDYLIDVSFFFKI